METLDLSVFLIEFNIILSLVVACYFLFLRKLTHFRWVRAYFLAGMLAAIFVPLAKNYQTVTPLQNASLHIVLPVDTFVYTPQNNVDYAAYLITFLLLVGLVFLLKILLELFVLGRIHRTSKKDTFGNDEFQNVSRPIAPFSFMKWIYLHKNSHSDAQLYQIIGHEKVHVKELHSIDVILGQLCKALAWYNPLVWFLNLYIKQNLEYITDQKLIQGGIDKKMYQYSLLHVATLLPSTGLSNNFNLNSLKNRIVMMNKRKSARYKLFSFLIITPLILGLGSILTFSCQKEKTDPKNGLSSNSTNSIKLSFSEDEKLAPTLGAEGVTLGDSSATLITPSLLYSNQKDKPLYYLLDGKEIENITSIDINTIESVEVFKETLGGEKFGEKGKNGAVVVTSKKSASNTSANAVVQEKKLEGKVIGYGTGTPNKVIVRGTSSINANPLFIVDGKALDTGSMQHFNPDEIESITVLKDDASKALYGKAAENGVLLITTKFGLSNSKPQDTGITISRDQNKLSLKLRGNLKMDNGKSPLVVLNGVPVADDLTELNHEDIEVMTILKDEASRSLYGKAGEHGVILITTKK